MFYNHTACREPKVSELVRQKVLPHRTPSRYFERQTLQKCNRLVAFESPGVFALTFNTLFSAHRKTPVQIFYSSRLERRLQAFGPTKASPVLAQLPPGFHRLYTQIEYECASPYYQHHGSSRRTCLKTGKWSGRHVSCSPGEGSKAPAVCQQSTPP